MVPPIRLWDAGVPNRGGADDHDPQLPDAGVARRRPRRRVLGLPDGRAPARRAVRPLRPRDRRGLLRRDPRHAPPRRTAARSSSKIPVGEYVWEDYAEHDGVDEPRLHTQRITLTRTAADDPDGERLILDFAGTAPQAKGPINHCGDYADGNFLKKWLAPILRNLADTPERMAELDVNEGVVPLIEMRFPPPGTLLTPVFPAPTNARTFVILRLLGVLAGVRRQGRRRPDARRPGDDPLHRRLRRGPRRPRRTSCARCSAAAPAAATTPTARTPSTSCPTRGTCRPSSPRRASRSSSSGSAWPWTPAAPGSTAAAWATRSTSGCSRTPTSCRSPTARSWPAGASRAARPGRPFQVTIDPGGPNEREVDALADAEPVQAGEVIRIRTTGGGGWGDPLERDPTLVVARRALGQGLARGARCADYGVVLTGVARRRPLGVRRRGDRRASGLRAARRPSEPFFDRGPGYARLAAGARPPRSTGCGAASGSGGPESPESGAAPSGGNVCSFPRVASAPLARLGRRADRFRGNGPVERPHRGGRGDRQDGSRRDGCPARGAAPRRCRWAASAWIDLAGALAGCDAAYVIAPNMHPDEAAYTEAVVTAAQRAGVARLVLHSVASPYVPAMPHHVGKAQAEDVVRRSGLAWSDPAARRLRAELRSRATTDPAALPRRGAVRLRRPRRRGARWPPGCCWRRGTRGRPTSWRPSAATVAELAAARWGRPSRWSARGSGRAAEGAGLEPRVRDWLLAMFAYYDRHGLPVGTLPMRVLLDRRLVPLWGPDPRRSMGGGRP